MPIHKCTYLTGNIPCGLLFKRRNKLHEHERIHTGETPYECKPCDRRFRRYEEHRRHNNEQHLNNKRFVCGGGKDDDRSCSCGEKFFRRAGLNLHYTRYHASRLSSLEQQLVSAERPPEASIVVTTVEIEKSRETSKGWAPMSSPPDLHCINFVGAWARNQEQIDQAATGNMLNDVMRMQTSETTSIFWWDPCLDFRSGDVGATLAFGLTTEIDQALLAIHPYLEYLLHSDITIDREVFFASLTNRLRRQRQQTLLVNDIVEHLTGVLGEMINEAFRQRSDETRTVVPSFANMELLSVRAVPSIAQNSRLYGGTQHMKDIKLVGWLRDAVHDAFANKFCCKSVRSGHTMSSQETVLGS